MLQGEQGLALQLITHLLTGTGRVATWQSLDPTFQSLAFVQMHLLLTLSHPVEVEIGRS